MANKNNRSLAFLDDEGVRTRSSIQKSVWDIYLIRTPHRRYSLQKAPGIVLELLKTIVILKLRVISVNKRSATRELGTEEVAEPHFPEISSSSPGSIRMPVESGDSDYT